MNIKTLITSLAISIFVVALLFAPLPHLGASTGVHKLLGWGWSSTIGWIGFGGTDQSNVNTAINMDSGQLTGYAWSSNIGWIDLNPTSGYPTSPNHGAKLNKSTNKLEGWARAISPSNVGESRRGGWDGWIKMSDGNNYGIQFNEGSQFPFANGLAWGHLVDSWVSFNQVRIGPNCTPGVDCPNECPPGQNCSQPCPGGAVRDANGNCPDNNNNDNGLSVQCELIVGGEARTSGVVEINAGDQATWNADVSGGNNPYDYAWIVSSINGIASEQKSFTRTYAVPGDYDARVQVADINNVSVSETCGVTLRVLPAFDFEIGFGGGVSQMIVNRPPNDAHNSSSITVQLENISGNFEPVELSVTNSNLPSGPQAVWLPDNVISSPADTATLRFQFDNRGVTPLDANISSPYSGTRRIEITGKAISIQKTSNEATLRYFDPREQSQ